MSSPTYPQLDETDRAIVDLLRQDGRMPYREIARRLDVSESMVRKRAGKLLDAGWMRIMAITDPLRLGVPILATTYAKVHPGAIDDVTDRLKRLDAVRYVAVGLGGHNLVVESLHGTHADLHAFIRRELGLEGIIGSETIQVVEIHKSVWDWEIPEPSHA